MKTIICPTDFSRAGNNAVRYAFELAKKTKAGIILQHTYEIPIVYSDVAVASYTLSDAEMRKLAEKKLNVLCKRLSAAFPKVSIETEISAGLASDRIIKIAKEKKADLIVMSATSSTAVERALIGSNTARVINNAPCELLVVPPSCKFRDIKKIVYTTNLKESNLKEAKVITRFAEFFKASLIFLFVDTKLLSSDDKTLEKMTRQVKQHVQYSKIAGYVCNDADVASGIRFFLKKHPANLLCMITHHRGFLEGLWNRSVTSRIAAHLTIPLLVLR